MNASTYYHKIPKKSRNMAFISTKWLVFLYLYDSLFVPMNSGKIHILTLGTLLLLVACAFQTFIFYTLVGLPGLIPWDGTPSLIRPSQASWQIQTNNYFEAGPGNIIFYLIPLISLSIIVSRFIIKREPLRYLFINTTAAYVFYEIFSIITLILIILFESSDPGIQYNFLKITIGALPILALYVMQYQVDVIDHRHVTDE